MKSVTRAEFGSRMDEFMREAQSGETLLITTEGEIPLELRPAPPIPTREEVAAFLERYKLFRETLPKTVTLEEAMAWRHEGHRY